MYYVKINNTEQIMVIKTFLLSADRALACVAGTRKYMGARKKARDRSFLPTFIS